MRVDLRYIIQYDCQTECLTRGPLFSGMSEESCGVMGGTFCAETDCTDLQVCVDDYRGSENRAFAGYVNTSPNITDVTDPFECGRAREYFGFQDNFINDLQICEDIGQLALTKDFEILNEFFNQGSSGPPGESPNGDGPVLLSPIMRTL
jgi:hypothetical protein